MNTHNASVPRLRGGQISPLGLAALALGAMSPALGLYALWAPIQLATGPISPLIYIAAALLALPTAVSYAEINRVMPSAGAASTWLWKVVSPSVGYFIGLGMAAYFLIGALQQPILFGLFFQDLLAFFGISLPAAWLWAIAITVITIPIIWAAARGAGTSTRLAVIMMSLECIVVLALSVTILWVKAPDLGEIGLAPLSLQSATGGLPGFWAATILGLLAFAGFDVVSTAAEETAAPAEHVPRAIILTIVGITIFWVFTSWTFTIALPDESLREYSRAGMTAVTPMAGEYWGYGKVLIILSAFSGIAAIYVGLVLGASRIIFAMARHGLLPAPLAALDSVHAVPYRAIRFVFVTVVLLDIASLLVFRNGLEVFTWWAGAMVFFMTLSFAAVNVANLVLFLGERRRDFRLLQNLLIPVLGLCLNGLLLYEAFFHALWQGEWRMQKSIVVACLFLVTVFALAVALVKKFAPERLQGEAPLQVASGSAT